MQRLIAPILCLSVATAIGSEPSPRADGAGGARHALLIGINNYEGGAEALKRAGNLTYAARDAEQIGEALRARGFAPTNLVVMTTSVGQADKLYPTAANVRAQVRALAARMQDGDTAVVSFAGFEKQLAGNDDYYLCPADGDPDDLDRLVSLRGICAALDGARGEGKLVIVDSCRAHEGPQGGSPRPRLATRSVGVWFACSAGQIAQENAEKRHGVFSYHVAEGLRGAADADRDGAISSVELVSYVKSHIGKEQTPEFFGTIPRIAFSRAPQAESPPRAIADGGPGEARPLFNGRDLSGWQFRGKGSGDWAVEGGVEVTGGWPQGWLMTDQDYGDFELQLMYRASDGGNSGVLIRGAPADDPMKAGMEIQILDDASYPDLRPIHYTGALYNVAPRSRRAARQAGEWNAMRVVAKGSQVTVFVNDTQVLDVDLEDYKDQLAEKPWLARPRGRIGLQSWTGKVEFRDVRVIARGDTPAVAAKPAIPSSVDDESDFRPMFNGRDLAGWKVDGAPGGWRVEGGEIVASGEGFASSNFLISDRDYRNFALRLEFLVGEGANSGIGVRALAGERVGGRSAPLEVQIHDDEGLAIGEGEPTGSLFWSNGGPMARPTHQVPLRPRGEWNRLEVEARGRLVYAAVNGQNILVANLQGLLRISSVRAAVYRDEGRIGLQRHTGEVRFRNIRVKEIATDPQLVLDAEGHTGTVRAAVFSRDGTQLITAGHDKTIRIWDTETGKSTRVFRPPTGSEQIGEIFGLALSPDGKTLAAGGWYGRLFLIDVPSARMLHFIVGHADSVLDIDFSPDGRSVATAGADKTARIWEVATGKPIRTLDGHTGYIDSVRYSPDGRWLATGCRDKNARIYSVADGSLLTTITLEGTVKSVAWTRDSKTLITANTNGTQSNAKGSIGLWTPAGAATRQFEAKGVITSMRAADDGAVLYTWSRYPQKGAVILDLATGEPRASFDKSWYDLLCSAVSPDGRLAATGGFDAADLRVWRTADGEQLHQLRARGSVKWAAGWGPDGTSIAWGNEPHRDRPTRFDDMGPLTRSFELKTFQIGEATEGYQIGSPKLEDLQIEGNNSSELRIKRGAELITTIDTKPFGGNWRSAAWVDRDRLVIGSSSGDVSLVDARSGKLIRKFVGHVGTIWAIAPSPDRRRFLTASQDSTLRIWSLEESGPVLSLYFGDDGEWIAGAQKGYYAASTDGERMMGWHLSNGLNAMASYFPASQFRKTLYRPDVVRRIADGSNLKEALAAADGTSGRSPTERDVALILPPSVAITRPLPSAAPPSGKAVEVEALATTAASNPIIAMRLLLDGRPVADGFKAYRTPRAGEARERWSIEVPPGSHSLVVQAETAASIGLSAPVEVIAASDGPAAASGGSGTLFVLSIGINDYPDKKLVKLDAAVPDARSLLDAFLKHSKRLFRGIQTRHLLDSQATRANILENLNWLKAMARAGDVVVVFYAGHGYCSKEGVFYLVPYDAEVRNLTGTAIAGDVLEKTMGEFEGRTVLMLDACYAANIGVGARGNRKARSIPAEGDALLRNLVYESGLFVMSGAFKDEPANEEDGHGYFTRAIVEGLSGAADLFHSGEVEVDELAAYVKRRVRKLSGGDQEATMGMSQRVKPFPLSKP